ncbi:hypothetical protein TNCV_1819241 [Trichonephila clavipes]|nr:hypothetical protein TNCV_1819241 [Trichonephila clavipes]
MRFSNRLTSPSLQATNCQRKRNNSCPLLSTMCQPFLIVMAYHQPFYLTQIANLFRKEYNGRQAPGDQYLLINSSAVRTHSSSPPKLFSTPNPLLLDTYFVG